MKNTARLLFYFALNLSFLQAQVIMDDWEPPKYNCRQLDLPTGSHPRIVVDSENEQIRLEYAGHNLTDIFQCGESWSRRTDTLDQPALAVE
ncbi:MAG: hypothetical protein AAFN81_28160 [Bacteroidota bacterium]